MTITVTGVQWRQLLRPVLPHAGRQGIFCPAVALETDGAHLYAAASDRYTLGVARLELPHPRPATMIMVHPDDLRATLRHVRDADSVELLIHDRGLTVTHVAATGRHTCYELGCQDDVGPSAAWRRVLRRALAGRVSDLTVDGTVVSSRMLERLAPAGPVIMQRRHNALLAAAVGDREVAFVAVCMLMWVEDSTFPDEEWRVVREDPVLAVS